MPEEMAHHERWDLWETDPFGCLEVQCDLLEDDEEED